MTLKISIRAVVTVISLELVVIASAAWVHAGMPTGQQDLAPPSITIRFEAPALPAAPLTRGA
jgi:hypothetical protein